MKKNQLGIAVCFSLIFLSAIFLKPSLSYTAQKISVGVYDFKPLVFIDNGGAEGFFIDFLNYVAEKEKWEITYISGSWNDCLTRIENGKIDLQVVIAYSDERAKKLDFTDDYLILDWASVFKQKGSPIQTVFDLKDKTVSVVKGGITTDNFKKLLEQFGITCRLLEKEGNEDNFKAVHQREADAGISPNIYGTLLESRYNVERTAIVFSPIKLKFAVKKDRNPEILAILDKYIAELKADKSSVYYQSLNNWLTVYKEKEPLPRWALWILPVLILSSLILFILNQMLKKMVRSKTSELILSEERFRVLFEQAGVGVAQIETKTGRFIRINQKYCRIIGYTPDEMTALTFQQITHSEDLQADLQNMQMLTDGKIREFSMEKRYYHRNGSVVWVNLTVSPMWKIGDDPDYHIAVIRDISDRKHAEANLRASEQKYRRIVDTANEGIWMVDENERTTFVNQRMAEMLRYCPEEMMGQSFAVFIFEEDLRDHEKQMEGRKQGISGYYERRFRRKDNTAIWTIVSATPVLNDEQQFRGSFAMITDITERKQAEEALVGSEKQFRTLFESMIEGVAIHQILYDDAGIPADYIILDVNPAYQAHTGISAKDAVGKKASELYGAGSPPYFDIFYKVAVIGIPERFEVYFEPMKKHFSISVFSPAKDQFATVFEDITERKRAEEELRRRKEELDTVLDALPVMVWIGLDPECRIITGNRAVNELIGIQVGSNVSQTAAEAGQAVYIRHLKPDGTECRADELPMQRAIATGQGIFNEELEYSLSDGRHLFAMGNAVPLFDENNRVRGVVAAFLDITERKQMEKDRRKLESQLRQAQKMEAVGQLAGGVAHDFNNLLQVIIGYGDMILDRLPTGELLHKNMTEMMKSAHRAAALVRQLLLFSRHDTMRTKSVDLTGLISNLMNMIRRVIGEHISLEIRPGFAVKPVSADPGQIEQVLMNLCVNARDAMPDGGRIIIATENILIDDDYIRQHQWAKKGQYVVITVSDTGCGIPHDIQERIFEPFFTTKEVGKGTGLGLATVYGIVRSHQGMVHLYSEPGHGAAFKIYLPIEENPSGAVCEKENIKPHAVGKETIMIAEDEDVVRNMIVHVLENSGYRVLSACNGEEAISLFEKHCFETDLVISDVIMPKVSGQKVYEHIRAIRPDIAVIFMSGYTRELLNPEIFEENCCEMIQKPCTPSVLLQKIRAVLDANHVQRRNT